MGQLLCVVEKCNLGIEAFLAGAATLKGGEGYEKMILERQAGDAEQLAVSAIGIPFEEGKYPLRLRYSPRTGDFNLVGNEMEYGPFRALQDAVGQEFSARGLTLYRMLEKRPQPSCNASLVIQSA